MAGVYATHSGVGFEGSSDPQVFDRWGYGYVTATRSGDLVSDYL